MSALVMVDEFHSDEIAVNRGVRAGMHFFAFRLAQYAFLFLSAVVIARALGPVGRAQFALPLTLATTVWVVVHLSLDAAAGRLLARQDASLVEAVRFLATSTFVLGVIGVVATVSLGSALRTDLLAGASGTAVLLAALSIPFSLAAQMTGTLLSIVGALRAYGWVSAAAAGVQLALVLVLAGASDLTPERAIAATLAWIIALSIGLVLALARQTGFSSLALSLDRRIAKAALRAGFAFHISSIAFFLSLRLDLFLVAAFRSAEQAGYYSLAASLAEFIWLASATVALAALPTQTTAATPVAVRYTVEFVRQNVLFAAFMALVFIATAYPFIVLVFGKDWKPSVLPLIILTVASIALAAEAPARALLVRIARPILVSAPGSLALVVNVMLALALIPAIGIIGAAIASVVSYWTAALGMIWLLQHETRARVAAIFSRPRASDPIVSAMRAVIRATSIKRHRVSD
jgi:O-antigen/teichoic acid export membrane protein